MVLQSAAELNWHVQIEVLRKIVKPMFYYRETDLIVPLVECTLEVARKTESLFSDVESLQVCTRIADISVSFITEISRMLESRSIEALGWILFIELCFSGALWMTF